MGLTYDQSVEELVFDCENGHYDCSRRPGGPCFGAAIAESAGIIARARNNESQPTEEVQP